MSAKLKDFRFKLTPMQYRSIRRLYKLGWKQSAIAAKYGVSQQYVSVIVRGV